MKKKRIMSVIIAILTVIIIGLVPSFVCMALGNPRDPNGDGFINIQDSVFIKQFLGGSVLPYKLSPLDFDKNGLITKLDSQKVELYNLNLYNAPSDDPNDPIEYSNGTTRTYWRHDYNSNDSTSYYEYDLSQTLFVNNVGDDTDVIIGSNDMIRDYDKAVVKLSTGGTGFIIGDHTIATAAHCIFDQITDSFLNITIEVIDTDNTVLSTMTPRYAHINKEYSQSDDGMYDYALIYVTTDLSQYGKFDLGIALRPYIDNEGQVIVSGFPSTYPPGYTQPPYGLRFKSSGNLISSYTGTTLLAYDADMASGQSGGPVYVEEGIYNGNDYIEYKTAIAINTTESDTDNFGVRITEDLIKFYKKNTYLVP